jgi:hypothetical protein
MQMEYVPDAGRALRGVNLQALNAASLNPIEPGEFARRVQAAANLPESFLVGLRSADGTWLSLIGGWRQGTTTVLHWQMNRAGYEKHSLGTVMRSFFLENEIAHGATDLFIYGGTPHSMRHAFDEQPVADLVLQRRCWTGEALRRASGLLRRYAKVGGADFLLECLHSSDMQWTEPGKSLPRDAPKLLRPAHGHKVA